MGNHYEVLGLASKEPELVSAEEEKRACFAKAKQLHVRPPTHAYVHTCLYLIDDTRVRA